MRGTGGPIRQCAGCRVRRPKGELLRFVRTPEGAVEPDAAQRAPGRGAYTCPDPACLDRALRKGGLSRVLRVDIPAASAQRLRRVVGIGRGVS
ncbi:MAG TPA: YlxR family protein [Actinomycetota bacterium]|nr:YlxR family protein [Actinomycetota bacterium]